MIYTWGGGGTGPNDYTFAANATLSGCRLTSSTVYPGISLMRNYHAHDASAMFHIHGDEGTGVAQDSVATYHCNPTQWDITTQPGDAAMAAGWGSAGGCPNLLMTQDHTIEMWWFRGNITGSLTTAWQLAMANSVNNQYIVLSNRSVVGGARGTYTLRNSAANLGVAGTISTGWHRLTGERYNGRAYHYVNGVLQNAGGLDVSSITTQPTLSGFYGYSNVGEKNMFLDIYGTQSALYSGTTFTAPTLYPASGTCVITHGLGAGKVLSAIDWSHLSGVSYGYISLVEVNTGSDAVPNWVAVSGANPTPPLTGLSYTVPQNCVRFTLIPSADTLLTVSPILQNARLELSAADPGSTSSVRYEPSYGIVWEESGRTALMHHDPSGSGDSYIAHESGAFTIADAGSVIEKEV